MQLGTIGGNLDNFWLFENDFLLYVKHGMTDKKSRKLLFFKIYPSNLDQ